MSKKIVIVPTFCDAHLIRYQIDNIMNVIDPDYLIYNECLWPLGPENLNNMTDEFISKYCKPGTKLGFDTDEVSELISNSQKKYSDKKIIHHKLEFFEKVDSNIAYLTAVSYLGETNLKMERGDLIFPYEADVFFHINDKDKLNDEIKNLKEDESFRTNWIDFIGTQYYTERKFHPNFGTIKGRKVCIKFGSFEYYAKINLQCLKQDYSECKYADIKTFHYNWFKPGPYSQFRYDQLHRNDGYWTLWDNAIKRAIEIKNTTKEDIRIRNTGNYNSDHISYIELEHPAEIKNHPNFVT